MKSSVSFSEFSSEDINADQLASELGLAEYKISREHDEAVINALSLIGKMVQDWPEYDLPQLGAVLQKHEKEIEAIFDSCTVSWRLPLHITTDMYFQILTGYENGEAIFRNIINCWKWYAYNKAQERDVAFYEGKEGGTYFASQRAQEEIERMMQGSWGRRHKSWIKMIGAGERVAEFDSRMSAAVEKFFREAHIIPSRQQLTIEMNNLFSLQNSTLFERLFIDNSVSAQNPAIDIYSLNFLLCQTHIANYAELVRSMTLVLKGFSDHIPAWKEWIKKYFDLIVQPDSEVRKSFYYAFSLKGSLFENGKISKRLKRRGFKTTEGIPEELCLVLEHLEQQRRTKLKQERKSSKPAKVVAQIMTPIPAQTAINTLVTRAAQPEKIIVSLPATNTVFPELAEAKKNNKQLTQIDLSGCDFPEGTIVQVKRSKPTKKKREFEDIKGINPRGKNIIEPVLGKEIQGHFAYIIAFHLPQTHRFEGSNFIEVSYYAKAEPTPEEIEEQIRLLKALKDQPKGPEKTVPAVVEQVGGKVEHIIDPVSVSLTAVAMVLEAKKEVYSGQEYSGGPIIVTLTDDDVDVLGDDAKAVLPEHKQWIITEDGIITPAVSDPDVTVLLTDIVDTIRTRYQTEQQQREAELQQQRELEEYEKARKEFEPILSFAKAFRFEGREKGDFEAQKAQLREELKKLGWSIPVVLRVLRFSGDISLPT